jgi:hypothetical protein
MQGRYAGHFGEVGPSGRRHPTAARFTFLANLLEKALADPRVSDGLKAKAKANLPIMRALAKLAEARARSVAARD